MYFRLYVSHLVNVCVTSPAGGDMVVIGSLVLHPDEVSCDVHAVTDHCLISETACVPLSSNCIQGVFSFPKELNI